MREPFDDATMMVVKGGDHLPERERPDDAGAHPRQDQRHAAPQDEREYLS